MHHDPCFTFSILCFTSRSKKAGQSKGACTLLHSRFPMMHGMPQSTALRMRFVSEVAVFQMLDWLRSNFTPFISAACCWRCFKKDITGPALGVLACGPDSKI